MQQTRYIFCGLKTEIVLSMEIGNLSLRKIEKVGSQKQQY